MADPIWVDGSTPLNSLNLTKLQTRDEKAAASGYASLDSGGKVPVAQLPASAVGVPVPTVVNGQWLKGVGGAAVWAPITPADISAVAYQAYTPLAGGGISLGNGTRSGRYLQIGKTVHCIGQMNFGTTTALGAAFAIGLPVPAHGIYEHAAGVVVGTHGSVIAAGMPRVHSADPNYFEQIQSATWPSGNPTGWGAGVPFAWASGDYLVWSFVYEAA